MIELLIAALLFVGWHMVASSPGPRAALVGRLGEQRFSALYSAVAGVGLAWLIWAYARSDYIVLWEDRVWVRVLPVLIMPAAVFLLVCGLSQTNPTMVGRRFDKSADPAPGVLKITRHPVMWAFGLWALSHLPVRGDLNALILFASIGFLALYGTTRIDARRRAKDPEGFARFEAVTSNLPLLALIENRAHLTFADIGVARIAGAVALYVALWLLHPLITGTPIY